MNAPNSDLLTVDDLVVEYPGKGWFAKPFRALRGVSVRIGAGETLGLVGESGSGKTTLGPAVLGLAPVTGGRIVFQGSDISHATRADRRKLSQDLQVVFQDPYSSLNPSLTVGDILSEPLGIQGVTGPDARSAFRSCWTACTCHATPWAGYRASSRAASGSGSPSPVPSRCGPS